MFHPRFAATAEADIRAAELTQADAELILAREHGFETFEALAHQVEILREKPTPFRLAFEAIKADDRAKFSALLKSDPDLVNAPGTNGNRLILLAMSFGRSTMVENLLAAGADPDLPNNKGWTALHQAAYSNPSKPGTGLATLDMLLEAGASPYAEAYGDGGTPLAVALFWGHARWRNGSPSRSIAPHESACCGRTRPARPDARAVRGRSARARKPACIANSIARTAAFRPGGRATAVGDPQPRR